MRKDDRQRGDDEKEKRDKTSRGENRKDGMRAS